MLGRTAQVAVAVAVAGVVRDLEGFEMRQTFFKIFFEFSSLSKEG